MVRGTDDRVAVLAIDPSSPFSGGAILGDRVRMGDHALDDGVFIRSMATRGHLGGLAVAAPEAVRVLTAAGYPWVLLETVGVGQVEVEVVGQADTTLVVVNPGWGDAVQANKAGLMEIADVFVVNKADRPGAKETARDLERMLDMAALEGWRPPVVCATATTGDGVDDVWQAVVDHRAARRGGRRPGRAPAAPGGRGGHAARRRPPDRAGAGGHRRRPGTRAGRRGGGGRGRPVDRGRRAARARSRALTRRR